MQKIEQSNVQPPAQERIASLLAEVEIHRGCDTPLYLQLRAYIEKWLDAVSVGDQLPPVRDIVQKSGVNLRTVIKAYQKFINEGTVVRSVKGTFKAAKTAEPPQTPTEMHPFNAANQFLSTDVQEIRFACYETMPQQRKAWTQIINTFNQYHNDIKAELVELPPEVATSDSYAEFLQDESVDVAMLHEKVLPDFIKRGILTRIPEGVKTRLNHPQYLTARMGCQAPEFLQYAAPLHYNFPCAFFNTRFLPETSVPPVMTAAQFVNFLQTNGTDLPASAVLFNNPAILMPIFGLPPETVTQQELKEALQGRFDTLQSLRPVGDRISFERKSHMETLAEFSRGNVFATLFPAGTLIQNLTETNVSYQASLIIPEAGFRLHTSASYAGLVNTSTKLMSSEMFLEFLLSPESQEILAGHGIHFTTYVPANERFQLFNRDAIEQVIPLLALFPGDVLQKWELIFYYHFQKYLEELIRAGRDAESIAEDASQRFGKHAPRVVSENS